MVPGLTLDFLNYQTVGPTRYIFPALGVCHITVLLELEPLGFSRPEQLDRTAELLNADRGTLRRYTSKAAGHVSLSLVHAERSLEQRHVIEEPFEEESVLTLAYQHVWLLILRQSR